MKKSLLVLAMTIVSFANAQKGTVLVLGNVGYYSQKTGDLGFQTNQTFNFSPKVGYQFNKNWAVGAESSISNSKQTFQSGDSKYNIFSAGGFVRYTEPIGSIFSAYVDLGAGYNSLKQIRFNSDANPSTWESNGNGFYVGVTPALFININKGFGLNFNLGSLGYSALNYSNSISDTQNFNFSIGQAFNIGISKNF